MKAVPLALFVVLVTLANVATSIFGVVSVGFGATVTAGTFAAGLTLVVRDWLQETAGRSAVVCAVVVGASLSWWLTAPALAVASAVAFAVSELSDWAVYEPVRRKNKVMASIASNTIGSVIDSAVFLSLAGFSVWPALISQSAVKTTITVLVVVMVVMVSRVVFRYRVWSASS